MKRFSILLLSIFFTASAYASIGTHNGLVSIGGGLGYNSTTNNTLNPLAGVANGAGYVGGGYTIELGYLYLKDANSFIHGVDTRLSFGQHFNSQTTADGEKIELPEGVKSSFDTTFFQVGTTYQIGLKTGPGRLMIDIFGLNLGYLSANINSSSTGAGMTFESKNKMGNNFLLGFNLPLGINYIMDNGLMIGFRHRIDMAFGAEYGMLESSDGTTISPDKGSRLGFADNQAQYLAYNLTFNIGYAFGK